MHGTNRETNNDKFYTPPETVRQLIDSVMKHYDLNTFTDIIEPSAGDGRILIPLYDELCKHDYKGKIHAYDLLPELLYDVHSNAYRNGIQISKKNWLEPYDENGIMSDDIYDSDFEKQSFYGSDALVIGNPPFGSNGSLALKFINESACFARVMAFILPLSFMKSSRRKLINEYYHIIECEPVVNDEYILPDTDGHTRRVPTCIMILEKHNQPRNDNMDDAVINDDLIPFTFVSNNDYKTADYMIIRVGGKAGSLEPINHANETNAKYNYFIRLKPDYDYNSLYEKYSMNNDGTVVINDNSVLEDNMSRNHAVSIDYIMELVSIELNEIRNMTAGPRSVSKSELLNAVQNVIMDISIMKHD